MNGTPKTYTIRTTTDFLKIPHDRLGACLRDFQHFLKARREVERLVLMVASAMGHEPPRNTGGVPVFIWRDDDKPGGVIKFNILARYK